MRLYDTPSAGGWVFCYLFIVGILWDAPSAECWVFRCLLGVGVGTGMIWNWSVSSVGVSSVGGFWVWDVG